MVTIMRARTLKIKFTTSHRGDDKPLFYARKKLFMKGVHQLSIRWMSTWYRVKGDKKNGFYVYLDKSINGNRCAIIEQDSNTKNYVVDHDEIFNDINEVMAYLEKNESNMNDYDIISIK